MVDRDVVGGSRPQLAGLAQKNRRRTVNEEEVAKLQRLKDYVCAARDLEEFLARLGMVRADELEKQEEAGDE